MDGDGMTGRDFLPLATRLAGGPTEAEWRTSVGRSYYAAFHEVRHLFANLGFTVPKGEQAHAYLWLRLSNCGDTQVEQTGVDLSDLRRRRNQADYDLQRKLLQTQAAALAVLAEQIIHTLDALTPAARTQVTDAMKVYERDVLHDVTWHP
jgi:uncharacterized protein (UPF0332 family)